MHVIVKLELFRYMTFISLIILCANLYIYETRHENLQCDPLLNLYFKSNMHGMCNMCVYACVYLYLHSSDLAKF